MKYVECTEVREEDGEMATAIIRLSERMDVLSNAPLNGGHCLTDTIFIMQVSHDYDDPDYLGDLRRKREQYGLPADSIGFMTAAEVKYVFSTAEEGCGDNTVFVAATAGVTNCVCAGDELDNWERRKAHSREIYERLVAGTINIVAVSSLPLTNGAKANLMMPIVEGKTLAMSDRGFGETGTTSDAVAIVSPVSEDRARFAGTGTPLGIAAARGVRRAVAECLENRGEAPIPRDALDMLGMAGVDAGMLWDVAAALGLKGSAKDEFEGTVGEMASDPDIRTLVYGVLSAGLFAERDGAMVREGTPEVIADGTLVIFIASRISEERGSDSAVDAIGLRPLEGRGVPEYAEAAAYGLAAGVVAYLTGFSDD